MLVYIYIFRCLLHRRGPQNQLFALIQFQWIFLGGWSTLYNHFLIYPVSFPIGIQSPNLRMGAWNLNTKSVSLRWLDPPQSSLGIRYRLSWKLLLKSCHCFKQRTLLLSQRLNLKLFGITYLVGKIKVKLFFSGSIGWVSSNPSTGCFWQANCECVHHLWCWHDSRFAGGISSGMEWGPVPQKQLEVELVEVRQKFF